MKEVLNEYEALIWIEPPNVFTSSKIEPLLNLSKQTGLLTWPLSRSITQLTHPSMFSYFKVLQSDFFFMHTIDTSKFIVYNNERVHTGIMLPWVKCALRRNCIAPKGAKYSGCDFTKRPRFLYSGCHRYEMSAFSIITALLFNYDQSKYTAITDFVLRNESSGIAADSIEYDNEFDQHFSSDAFAQKYQKNTLVKNEVSTSDYKK
jgi:hypothetical protein